LPLRGKKKRKGGGKKILEPSLASFTLSKPLWEKGKKRGGEGREIV